MGCGPRTRRSSATASCGHRSTTSAFSTDSAALDKGEIGPADFVDLNAKIGGLDIDANPTAARDNGGGSPSLARAYQGSGMINETNNLNQTAIIDCREPRTPGSSTTRTARLPPALAWTASMARTPTS